MSQHPQPAAELIANALAKIKKLAGNKKHADLAHECQKLIDSIHEVRQQRLPVPAVASSGMTKHSGKRKPCTCGAKGNQGQPSRRATSWTLAGEELPAECVTICDGVAVVVAGAFTRVC
jgi:hypothetical protein